jgi:hypothetical protein
MKVCFDALRLNKEKSKLSIMTSALNEDMDVTLEKYAKFRSKLESKIVMKMKLNVCKVVRTALGRKLFSYFKRWKLQTDVYRQTFFSKFKDQVCLAYRRRIIAYFLLWKTYA